MPLVAWERELRGQLARAPEVDAAPVRIAAPQGPRPGGRRCPCTYCRATGRRGRWSRARAESLAQSTLAGLALDDVLDAWPEPSIGDGVVAGIAPGGPEVGAEVGP
eukprot:9025136-Alexandrium_andersonii.AAC.1